MSKFKVIQGSNVTSIASSTSREIREIENRFSKMESPTDRDVVVCAYHFVRLGHLVLAQKYLNSLSSTYFETGIYKDLFQSLLSWSITQNNPQLKSEEHLKAYEYFIVVRRATEMFQDVNFTSKVAFNRFKQTLQQFSQGSNLPNTEV